MVTADPNPVDVDDRFNLEKDLIFTPSINETTQELTITLTDYSHVYRGAFTLADIQARIEAASKSSDFVTWDPDSSNHYRYHFERRKAGQPHKLKLMDNIYLRNRVTHRLLPVDTMKELDITLDAPFFFTNAHRTYFVRPVDVPIIDRIRYPDKYLVPDLPYLEEERRYAEIPHVGPDDYRPVGDFVPDYTVVFPVYAYGASETVTQPASYTAVVGGNVVGMPVARVRDVQPDRAARHMMSDRSMTMSKSYELGADVGIAFDVTKRVVSPGILAVLGHKTGLEFHTFHHPFSSVYVRNLNQGGLSRGNKPSTYPPGLLDSDTEILSDDGSRFETAYDPDFNFVLKPSDFQDRTYYKENVCFDPLGANSQYNWELFFHAPLYIATRLSRNGKFKEAMQWFHYIFDPTTDAMPGPGESDVSRYWKVPPFKTTPAESIEQWFRDNLSANTNRTVEHDRIEEWRNHPFDPHLIASNRPIAYMKHVVVKYIENLIAWGDFLFRQFTRESVNEALQIYVIASHILGPRPQFVPKRGEIKAESYKSLERKWDDFSNALVQLENIFPYSSAVAVGGPYAGGSLLGIGSAFYFCIPPNDKLLEQWDTVADRLYKIRHCQNIEGVEQQLALFAPPIDPAALIQAASKGLSLGNILADLSSPPPIYRFTFLIQKANEFCSDVKALGALLLAALEKKDAEELARLRATHETQMLELITAIKERQVLDARAMKENLEKGREVAQFRLEHYHGLLGEDSITIPAEPQVDAVLTADSQLPPDTTISEVTTGADESLVDSDESGVKLISKEKEDLDKSWEAMLSQQFASGAEGIAGLLHLLPSFSADGKPLGVGGGISYGGPNIGAAASGLAKVPAIFASVFTYQAAQASKTSGYIRREQDWTLQANLASKEIIQLDKQITSADIRIQVTKKELENHRQQIDNAKAVELFLKDRFTNQELYQWMKEQLFAVYKQSYNLAYDMARKAEKAFQYEMGNETASFIQYGYWDNAQQGLTAGEKLQLALRQLEKSFIEGNRRELELTKSISLAKLDPLALIQLRETGKCYVSIPEELFDLDFRGHYFRRIKSVRLSIPCVAGPYTAVNCSLRLLNNSVRTNTTMNGAGGYEHENDEGIWIDDDRFRTSRVPVTAIAASTAQNDPGMFEFSFRDERYLPFEGAGAISEWQIELCTERKLLQFDYATISDAILHLNYTAREDGGLFKVKATEYLTEFIKNSADLSEQPLVQFVNLKHEFPTEWYHFLHPTAVGGEQILKFTLGKDRFPFFAQAQDVGIVVMKIDAFAKCSADGDYHLRLSYVNVDGDTVDSAQMTMSESEDYGGLKKVRINATDAGLNLEELDIAGEMRIKLKHNGALVFSNLAIDPDETSDLFLVVHYKLQDLTV